MATPTVFDGPIPGQSLTDEPKNAPWENPPVHADPLDAFEHYMKKLVDPQVQDNFIDMVDLGLPISVVADAMLSKGVMDGIHSVDVKLLLKPYLTMQLKEIADVTGIEYKMTMEEFRDKDAEAEEKRKRKLSLKLKQRLELGLTETPEDPGMELEQTVVDFVENEDMEEMPQETEEVADEAPKGLMAKEI